MSYIQVKTPDSPYFTTLNTEAMDVEIRRSFLGVRFITDDGEVLSVCMRDSGFELSYSDVNAEDNDGETGFAQTDISLQHGHVNTRKEGSNLVEHARLELEALGEEPDVIRSFLSVISAFTDYGHSGGSGPIFIEQLNRLLNMENLTPITNNPAEWIHHGEDIWGEPGGIWQNTRNPKAFSKDGGATYAITEAQGELDFTHTSANYEPKKEEGLISG